MSEAIFQKWYCLPLTSARVAAINTSRTAAKIVRKSSMYVALYCSERSHTINLRAGKWDIHIRKNGRNKSVRSP